MSRPRIATLVPEALVIALGVSIRCSFLGNTDASATYDLIDHIRYLEWFRDHLEPAPLSLSRLSYGAPLYYFLGGLVLRGGGGLRLLADASVLLGSLRLVVIAIGLRIFLPADRIARLTALFLAAVLPAAVHIDGMINHESLHMLLVSLGLLPWAAFGGDEKKRVKAAVVSGVLIGLALWTKISSLVVLLSFGVGAGAAMALDRRADLRAMRGAVAPWLIAAAVACAVASPWYLRTLAEHGQLAPTAFEGGDAGAISEEMRRTPLLRRRPAAFYFGITSDVLKVPHVPSTAGKFFPTVLATTFSDYYLYRFTPRHQQPTTLALSHHGCGWSKRGELLAQLSVAAGSLIAVATLSALVGLAIFGARRRRPEWLALISLGVGAVAAQLLFAVKYPLDHYGVVKGTYLQFAAFPLFAGFGVGVSWCWRRGVWGRVAAGILIAAAGSVATYSIASRAALV